MMIKTIYSLSILFMISLGAFSQTIPLDPAVKTGKLLNGFTYYIKRDSLPKGRVKIIMANRFGAIVETDKQLGMAQFIQRMTSNNYPILTASTGFEETTFQCDFGLDSLKWGIQVMRDCAHSNVLKDSDINQLQLKTLNNLQTGNSAYERMARIYLPEMLKGSVYATHLPDGTLQTVSKFNRQNLLEFYNDWYRPDVQAIFIVGDFDVKDVEEMVKDKFSDLKNPPTETFRKKFSVKLDGSNKFLVVTDKEQAETVLQIIIKHTQPPSKTVADFRASMVQDLLNQLLTKRFAASKGSSGEIRGLAGGLDIYLGTATVGPGKDGLENGFKDLWSTTEKIREFGFTEAEFSKVKANYMGQINAGYARKSEVSSDEFAQKHLQYFLREWSVPGITLKHQLYLDLLPGINLSDVNKMVKSFTADQNRDIVILAPEKEKDDLPDDNTIHAWMN